MEKKLLLLEDERSISEFMEISFIKEGFHVFVCDRGKDAIEVYRANPDIDIAILDVMLPDISGFDVCKSIRAEGGNTGIIMLTAKSQETDRITGLMLGADDYVVKPFSPSELMLRVNGLFHRIHPEAQKALKRKVSGPFTLDEQSRSVTRDGVPLVLTQVEYQLMNLFMSNPGKALSRDDILRKVWGEDYKGEIKTVDVNIRRLRIKIENDPANPVFVQTVWGFGYIWAE